MPGFVDFLASIPAVSLVTEINLHDRAAELMGAAAEDDRLAALTYGGLKLDPARINLEGAADDDARSALGYAFDDVRADATSGHDGVELALTVVEHETILDHVAAFDGPNVERSGGTVRVHGGTCPPLPPWVCVNSAWSRSGEAIAMSPAGAVPSKEPPISTIPDAVVVAEELDARGAVAALLYLGSIDYAEWLADCEGCDQDLSPYEGLAYLPGFLVGAAGLTAADEGVLVLRYAFPGEAKAAADIVQEVLDRVTEQRPGSLQYVDAEVIGTLTVVQLRSPGGRLWPDLQSVLWDIFRTDVPDEVRY